MRLPTSSKIISFISSSISLKIVVSSRVSSSALCNACRWALRRSHSRCTFDELQEATRKWQHTSRTQTTETRTCPFATLQLIHMIYPTSACACPMIHSSFNSLTKTFLDQASQLFHSIRSPLMAVKNHSVNYLNDGEHLKLLQLYSPVVSTQKSQHVVESHSPLLNRGGVVEFLSNELGRHVHQCDNSTLL